MAINALLLLALASTSDAAIYLDAFERARAACAEERAAIWPVSLCGPMLVADREAGRLFADRPDPEGLLEALDSGLFTGSIPDDLGLANTAVEFGGERWALVLAPLPKDPLDRTRLLLHESFHRIQPELGIPMPDAGSNGHVDAFPGRLWLRLEWRALAAALTAAEEGDFRDAVRDALRFRLHRYALIDGAREAETALELNEGLAEYSAMRAAYVDPRPLVSERLARAETRETLIRSFAYESGPAWGLVLDRLCDGWPGSVQAGANFTELVQCFAGPGPDQTPERRAERFHYAEVLAEEEAREQERQALMARLAARFVEGPVVVLPLRSMQMQFDPNRVTAFPGHGTVYEGLMLSDQWGRVEAPGGALISSDLTELIVPGTPEQHADARVTGDGWSLELAAGWRVESSTGRSQVIPDEPADSDR